MLHSRAPGPLPDRRALVICTGFTPSPLSSALVIYSVIISLSQNYGSPLAKTITFYRWYHSLAVHTMHLLSWKYFESFEMWSWKMTGKFSWTDLVKNEEVFTYN